MAFTSNLRQTPIAEKNTGLISDQWAIYFRDQDASIAASPALVPGGNVVIPQQGGAIGATPIPTGALVAGLYRVTWYLRVTTPAGTSSSVGLSIGWIEGGVACSFAGPPVTGNTNASVQSQTFMMHIDPATPLSYAVGYASTPAGMQYALYLVVELVQADA